MCSRLPILAAGVCEVRHIVTRNLHAAIHVGREEDERSSVS
jgi:hypothetical protein